MSYKPPYNITNRCLMLISSISEKIGKLESVNISTSNINKILFSNQLHKI